jgi:hypothetical protein
LSLGADVVVFSGSLETDQRGWPMLGIDSDLKGGVMDLRIASDQSCNLAEVSGGLDRRVVTLGVIGLYVSAGSSWSPDVAVV